MKLAHEVDRKILFVVMLILVTFTLTACQVLPVAIAASTHPITSDDQVTELGDASGSAWGVSVLGYSISEASPARSARDRAIESVGADALIAVTVEYRQINLFFAGFTQTRVFGKGVKLSKK